MSTVVSIVSYAKNAGQEPREIYIFTHDVSPENMKMIDSIAEPNVICHRVNMDRQEIKGSAAYQSVLNETHVSSCANYKFEIANALSSYERALYLDGDIIINRDIEELFFLDLEGYYLAAADDMGDTCENGVSRLAERIGIADRTYFNSGVMLLNLKKIREDHKVAQLYRYLEEGINYFVDQDALNYVLGEKRLKLSQQYNFLARIASGIDTGASKKQQVPENYNNLIEYFQAQKIIHMTYKYKPWQYDISHATDIFWKYYIQSPYKDYPLPLVPYEQVLLEQKDKIIQNLKDKREFLDWSFPYDIIKKGERVVLYGAGAVGRSIFEQNKYTEYCRIVLWVDQDYEQKDGISAPETILDTDYDIVVIAVLKKEIMSEIRNQLDYLGVEEGHIKWFHN
jgi:lipopolysaccharide biosynthesis glycosyltransferase